MVIDMDSHSDSARSKLDQILNDLAIKAEERVCTIEDDETLKSSPNDSDAMPPPTTPSKRPGRAPRKRKKKELFSDDMADSNRPSYVLMLFDRRVDMAQFHRNTSIYAMSRAWALNNPAAMYEIGTCAAQQNQQDEFDSLYSSLTSSKKDVRQPICPQAKPSQNASCLDDMIDAVSDIEILKADNIGRWRKVRESWRNASFQLQESHSSSLLQLKSLFTQP